MIHQRRLTSRGTTRHDPELTARGLHARMTRVESENNKLKRELADLREQFEEVIGIRNPAIQTGLMAEALPNGEHFITK